MYQLLLVHQGHNGIVHYPSYDLGVLTKTELIQLAEFLTAAVGHIRPVIVDEPAHNILYAWANPSYDRWCLPMREATKAELSAHPAAPYVDAHTALCRYVTGSGIVLHGKPLSVYDED